MTSADNRHRGEGELLSEHESKVGNLYPRFGEVSSRKDRAHTMPETHGAGTAQQRQRPGARHVERMKWFWFWTANQPRAQTLRSEHECESMAYDNTLLNRANARGGGGHAHGLNQRHTRK